MRRIRGGSTDLELAWDRRAITVAVGVSLRAYVGLLTWLILIKPCVPVSRGQERWAPLQIVRPFERRSRSDKRVPTILRARRSTKSSP